MKRNTIMIIAFCFLAAMSLAMPVKAEDLTYQAPPKVIADVVDAPKTPYGYLNPQNTLFLFATPDKYPPISDLAKPMLRLAGHRIDPTTNGPHNPTTYSNLYLRSVSDKTETPINLPAKMRPSGFSWNIAGTKIAFKNTTETGIELWVLDAQTGQIKQIPGVQLNCAISGRPYRWISDQKRLLVRMVPPDRPAPPVRPLAPSGPNVLEASGIEKASSTYEARDLLKDEFDAQLFDYYATSQLALVDPDAGKVTPVGEPAVYKWAGVSPDAKYILVSKIQRPYSYEFTSWRFPLDVEVWTISGELVYTVAQLPLADQVPIRGVRTGPQGVYWWATEDATLTWTEALDEGDWKVKVPHRSRVMRIKAPFKEKPEVLFKTELRTADFSPMESKGQGWLWTYDYDRHWYRAILVDLNQDKANLKLLWEDSWNNIYEDPGNPIYVRLPNGFWALQVNKGHIYLDGSGGSPDGYRPFLDRMDLATGEKVRLFRCDKDHYEYFVDWMDIDQGLFMTRRQSTTEPPNYFLRKFDNAPKESYDKGESAYDSTLTAITDFKDPVPELRKIKKELVTYKRDDGVELSFTVLYPPDYEKGKRYPTVLDAYPLDYTEKKMAGQVRNTKNTFTRVWGADSRLYALAGYVVLDNAAIPIVGPSMQAYDTYLEQLEAGAKAAIDKAVEIGVTDPDRVGVIGHSHGGLMVANLLAHTDLFKAGVARSGAYNKTMTMFGFQNERRTLWEGRQVYINVSPMFFADKINEPMLIIHGEIDQNPGTTPLQSELLFEAVRGNGGTARLVMLPFEGHGYRSKESVYHVLWEMIRWFDMYVK